MLAVFSICKVEPKKVWWPKRLASLNKKQTKKSKFKQDQEEICLEDISGIIKVLTIMGFHVQKYYLFFCKKSLGLLLQKVSMRNWYPGFIYCALPSSDSEATTAMRKGGLAMASDDSKP